MARRVREPVTPGRMGTAALGSEEGKRVDRLLQDLRDTVNAHATDIEGAGYSKQAFSTAADGVSHVVYTSSEMPENTTRKTRAVLQAQVVGSAAGAFFERVANHVRVTGAPTLIGAVAEVHTPQENLTPDVTMTFDVSGNAVRVLVNDAGAWSLEGAVWVEEFEHTP